MKTLAIIPARYDSSRFPGKPLIDLKGKTMIQRVYQQTSKASLVDKVIVATDDTRILNAVNAFGGACIMTSPNHSSGTERCGEVIDNYTDYDIIINVQGDEPLIQPQQIDSVLQLFALENTYIATAIKKINKVDDIQNPNRIKVVVNGKNEALYFSRSPIPHIANIPFENWLEHNTFWKHIGIYAWRTKTLKELINLPVTDLEKLESLEQLRWLFHGYQIKTVETTIETPNIDVPADVKKVIDLL